MNSAIHLGAEDTDAIAGLDTKQSAFFDHRDPPFVKWMADSKFTT